MRLTPTRSRQAVIGRRKKGERAATAIVLPREGARVGAETLRVHCSERLAPYKVPKQFDLVDEPLPRTRSGKLLRRQLT